MAVLYVPHFVQFFDDAGEPLAAGRLYTYAAGTTTPKATYTTAAGDVENTNPIVLDSLGRAVIFLSGSYKFALKNSADVPVGPNGGVTDNVTNFSAFTASSEGFFQSFSGDGATTAFTLSDNLGTDEKSLMVFSELEYSTNGTFATDSGWTKGVGWTISAGVATATGAISTALEQTAGTTIIQGKQYLVRYTVTRSAGSITPNLGGTAGTARSADGTYSETIIAGSTQTISFTTSGFTGTLDNVSIRDVGGVTIRNPADYTLSGTSLTFNRPPASGTNNVLIFAPYTLINAAGAAQSAADAAIAAQAAAEGAVNAVAYQYNFNSSTTMGHPGTGTFRLNNATLSSVTAIAVDALSSVTGHPDVSDFIATWGASTNTVKGLLKITKSGSPATFAQYNITAAVTDNTSWLQITVAHVDSNGSFSSSDVCYLQFTRAGDVGATGAPGAVTATSAVTAGTSAGAVLEANGGADCLTWGAGGGANVTINGGFSIAGTSSSAASIILAEDTDNGTNTVQLIAPASIASNRVITLPDADGTVALASQIPTITTRTRQILTSGTGATYTTPAGCTRIFVRAWGGGGGGAAQTTNAGSNGGATIFNSVTANGGGGAPVSTVSKGNTGGIGGSGGSGSATFRMRGNSGQSSTNSTSGAPGGAGGATSLGGNGYGVVDAAGVDAVANSGSGGGGACSGGNAAAPGGGAGEYFELDIVSPSATYTYTIGGGGAGGAAGVRAGGAGGSGLIIVEEFYS